MQPFYKSTETDNLSKWTLSSLVGLVDSLEAGLEWANSSPPLSNSGLLLPLAFCTPHLTLLSFSLWICSNSSHNERDLCLLLLEGRDGEAENHVIKRHFLYFPQTVRGWIALLLWAFYIFMTFILGFGVFLFLSDTIVVSHTHRQRHTHTHTPLI